MWQGNDRVFKTYVKGSPNGDGKAPAEKVKGRDEIRTFKDASKYECFGAILNDNYVDISFDDKQMYEKFLEMAEENQWGCLAIPSDKGGHTYWKDTGHRIKKYRENLSLAVGFVADVRHKSTYIPLRVHGKDRFPPDYDIYEDEEYDEVPEELLPVETKMSLWRMEESDGRNEDLFGYILVLQKAGMDKETIRRVLTNTNRFVFKQPLSDEELNVILRDESFSKPNFYTNNGKTLQIDKFAEWLKNEEHIIKINGQLHIYKDGVYVQDKTRIEHAMVEHIPGLLRAKRAEIMEYLNVIIEENHTTDPDYIAFDNGLYSVSRDVFTSFSPECIVKNRIRWRYDPEAYSKEMDGVLENITCGDSEIRSLMEEMIGYCFYRKNELRKAFILVGDGSNGKSTFLAVLQSLLGEENISALDLRELGDRFKTAEMFGKLANIGDDIGDEFIPDPSVFKKLVTGERVSAERKGQDPFEFNNYAKLVFSANDIPRIRDKTGAVLDRLVIVPFNAKFTVENDDYRQDIRSELVENPEVMEYLINIGIKGLKRILSAQKFTKSEKVQSELDDYRKRNNPITGFLEECMEEDFTIENQPTNDVYTRYSIYCDDNKFHPLSKIEFSRQLCHEAGMETKLKKFSGKTVRIFIKSSEETQ